MSGFAIRIASEDDIAEMTALMQRSIAGLQSDVLTPQQIEASFEIMGMDPAMIADGTYFAAVEVGAIIGCGGWSRRRKLFGPHGGGHADEGVGELMDPASEAARVRAMYTDPAHARRGVGRAILAAAEAAARDAGFRRAELVGTMAGARLYRTAGWEVLEEMSVPTSRGVDVPCLRMGKALA